MIPYLFQKIGQIWNFQKKSVNITLVNKISNQNGLEIFTKINGGIELQSLTGACFETGKESSKIN